MFRTAALLHPCSHLCAPTQTRARGPIRESHRKYTWMHSSAELRTRARARIIRKTPPIMIIRTLHHDPDVCPWHVRDRIPSPLYVIGKRGLQVSYLPSVIVRDAAMPMISESPDARARAAVRIDTFDHCGNGQREHRVDKRRDRQPTRGKSSSLTRAARGFTIPHEISLFYAAFSRGRRRPRRPRLK